MSRPTRAELLTALAALSEAGPFVDGEYGDCLVCGSQPRMLAPKGVSEVVAWELERASHRTTYAGMTDCAWAAAVDLVRREAGR